MKTQNRRFSLLILLAIIGQFIIFKLLYPFPDFFGDSYSYIDAAQRDLSINIWPIGYSKFLLWFQWFTHYDLALIAFQYFFLEAAAFYFYQTLIKFYPTRKSTRIILSIFLFCNPLNLYLSNYVSSDGMFWTLSLIWLTELLWILNRPNLIHLISLSIIFFVAFTFRYNAMYYPAIAALAFLVSKQSVCIKITGVLAGPALIIPFIIWSSNAAKQISGRPQFPPILGGWQWANNALYIREYIQEDSAKFPNPQTAELDQISRKYFRIVPPRDRNLPPYVGNFFIREPEAPLKQYMAWHYREGGLSAWAKVAPVFKQYGLYIIKRHPWAYFRYFMLMNSTNYFLPPLEKLEVYNLGQHHIPDNVIAWFHYRDNKIHAVSITFQGTFLAFYPYLFCFLNFYFCWSIFFFFRQNGFRGAERSFAFAVGLITCLLLGNVGFSIFANIIAFRYQLFPMTTLLSFALLISDYTIQHLEPKKSESKSIKIEEMPTNRSQLDPQI